MKKALSLAEVAMALVVVAIVIAAAAAGFAQINEKRKENQFWQNLDTSVIAAIRNSEATKITNNMTSAYGFVVAKGPYSDFNVVIHAHSTMDLMFANIPQHICRNILENFEYPSLIYIRVADKNTGNYIPNSTPIHCYEGARMLIAMNWR